MTDRRRSPHNFIDLTRKGCERPKTEDKKQRLMAYERVNQVIRIIEGRCKDHGELPNYRQLETVWWAISEGLAVAKGIDIDYHSVREYVEKRSETGSLFGDKKIEEIMVENIREACRLIEMKPVKYKLTNGEKIGRELGLTREERTKYKAFTIIAIDQGRAELKAMRKSSNRLISRHCMAKKRLAEGSKPHAESDARTKPWEKLGMSRATWHRHGKPFHEQIQTAEIVQFHPKKT